MQLLDCTLRDGANVVGNGFSAELTTMMIEGLIESNIKRIELGNALGLGAYQANQSIAPLNDAEYLDLIQPYLDRAEMGMFIGVKNVNQGNVELAQEKGLKFLRIGANAGDGAAACEGIQMIKKCGIKAYYSMMKGYILSSEELAEEAKMLESYGLDEITIMDSAGTMLPSQVKEYVERMVNTVKIPVGFHGHNNMDLSVANALAAYEAGASVLDCGLLGMARSAGNLATETAIGVFRRMNGLEHIDFYKLLNFIDEKLAPAMAAYGYKSAIQPMDLILGYAGCHSNFVTLFKDIAREKEVNLYYLIVKVSEMDQKSPSRELIESTADQIKASKQPILSF